MQVSSETLFHFTNSLTNIENILTKKFHPAYCNEKFTFAESNFDEYFPMVSFCDLPLGLIKSHIEKYGCYAIGMTKKWGIKNQLNPVLYLEKNSIITKSLDLALDNINALFDVVNGVGKSKEAINDGLGRNLENYVNILRYVKNYSGDLTRGTKTFPDYKFYDEREWRFVPSFLLDNDEYMNRESYLEYRGKSKSKPLIDTIKLDFSSSDIKYLIVKSESDIPKLIRAIKSIDNLCKNSNEADILTSKILTVDQIKLDI
jgi:hypothetical protein